jgi:hypothetical protein
MYFPTVTVPPLEKARGREVVSVHGIGEPSDLKRERETDERRDVKFAGSPPIA